MIPVQYKVIAIGLLLLSLGALGSWYHHRIWQAGYDQHVLETEASTAKGYAAYAAEIVKKGEQNEKNQLTIARLATTARELRLKFPTCTTTRADDSNGASGVAATRVDEYLDEAKRAIQDIGERCATLNISAIKANRN